MFNGKAESKTKKMIITKVVWYLFPEKKGTVVLRKGALGGPLGSSSQTIKDVGQDIPGRGGSRRQDLQAGVSLHTENH